MNRIIILFAFFLGMLSCAHKNIGGESNVEITKEFSGHKYKSIYFGAQPSPEAIANLKKNGFVALINMRGTKERNYTESTHRKLVKKHGLQYYHLPLKMGEELTSSYIDSVTALIKRHAKVGKVLVHCSSGNRVSVWIGAHFFKDHKYSKEEARAIARKLGMTKPGAKEKLEEYLATH